jgi:hypothetical protein
VIISAKQNFCLKNLIVVPENATFNAEFESVEKVQKGHPKKL